MQKQSPISPKSQFYQNTGDGRDTYISYNSGGFFQNKSINDFKFQGLQSTNNKIYSLSPRIPEKHTFYYPSGTGRDYYIIKSKGSGSQWELPKQVKFANSLRQYEPQLQMSFNRNSPTNARYFSELKQKNKDLLNRLFPLSPLKLPENYMKSVSEKIKFVPKFLYLQDSLLKTNGLPNKNINVRSQHQLSQKPNNCQEIKQLQN